MAIVFGGDFGLRENSFGNFIKGITDQFDRVMEGAKQLVSLERRPGTFIPIQKENVYVDSGFQNVPGTSFIGSSNLGSIDDIKKRRITTQSPELTVYIKKRLFSSLRNEHDTKFMDSGEKLFMRASKILFERKCSQIAAYEALNKLEGIITDESEFDASIVDLFVNTLDNFLTEQIDTAEENTFSVIQQSPELAPTLFGILQETLQKLKVHDDTIQALRKLQKDIRKTRNAVATTWVVDPENTSDITNTGRGAGVIELTLIDSINTQLGLEYGDKGSFNFTVENPYDLLSINNDDVEIALRSAYTEQKFADVNVIFLGPQTILEEARRKENTLRVERNNRLNEILINNPNPLSSSSDVAEIVFEVNPTSGSNYRVTGRIPTISEPFHKDNFAIVLAQALNPIAALTFEETTLVKQIFDLLEKYVAEVGRISASEKLPTNNKDVNYARRQLRKFYLGKNIIQPMDGVNVYIRGNTFRDNEVMGPLSSLLNANPFIRAFGENPNMELLAEEMRQFGLEDAGIPIELYRVIRTGTLLRNAGAHIFGGLVSNVSSDYNAGSGKYTLSVSGESNLKWLGLSRVNVTPSLDQTEGVLEDPLTPLDIEVDEATGLVIGTPNLSSENVKALSDGLYFINGDYKGERAKESNMRQDIKVLDNVAHSVWQHLPGLKYKWKQGVIVASRDVNVRTALDGRRSEIQKLRRDVGMTVVKDPFANLDIADVISLLITGEPHNYESFIINSRSIGTFTPGQANSPDSFFHSFADITKSTNRALGNFEPFKMIQIGREQMSKRLSLQTDLVRNNQEISKLQSEIAGLTDQLNAQSPPSEAASANQNDPVILNRNQQAQVIKARIDKLTATLNEKLNTYTSKIKEASSNGLRIYGDDIILENQGTTTYSDVGRTKDASSQAKLRSKFLQMRPQLSAKFNRDKNLFIVADDYDKDLDLQAFAINLASGEIPIWNSQYKHPMEICINAAKVIDFELFCDTQGHIQFRPPKYNKVPLSLLLKMILLSEEENIDLMSPFVKSLFSSRAENLAEEIKILTLEIDIIGLLLNVNVDSILDRTQITNIFLQKIQSDAQTRGSGDLVFGAAAEEHNTAEQIKNKRNQIASIIGTTSVSDSTSDINKIKEEIRKYQDPSSSNINTNRTGELNRLLQLSSRRQIVEETLQKIQERKEAFKSSIVGSKSIRFGDGNRLSMKDAAAIVEPFGDLIEDDFYDFLGPGSSKRFIIYDDQIINYSFKENDQNVYCRVDVTGQEDLLGEERGNIGGIPLIWAGATDFDLWKQYGWRAMDTSTKPFFKNGALQCAPYAMMLLTRQRRDIVRATVTVTGNEFYQLGDVVYINSKDLLYYVNGVSHSFSSSGGTFTTTLDLRYGHPLGDFIPTPLDVIGKNLIKNQRKFNTTFIRRRTAGFDIGRNVAVILFNSKEDLGAEQSAIAMLGGYLGTRNIIELKNALLIANSQRNSAKFKQVEVRGYTRKTPNSLASGIIVDRMDAVRNWLLNPIEGFNEFNEPIKLNSKDFQALEPSMVREIDLDLDPIDLSLEKQPEENVGRTPREETYNIASNDIEQAIEIVITFGAK